MDRACGQARAPWTLRQVLWTLLIINLFDLVINVWFKLSVQNLPQLALWELLDALVYIGGIYIFLSWRLHQGPGALGLHNKKIFGSVLIGAVTGLATALLVLAVGALLVKLVGRQPPLQPVQAAAQQAKTVGQTIMLLVTGSIVVPIKEEILFRGFLYPAFRDRVGVTWGIALTALVFAFSHADIMRFIPILLAGIILNLVYEKTGSLYASIVGHGVWNLIMSLLAIGWR